MKNQVKPEKLPSAQSPKGTSEEITKWHILTVIVLIIGYAGYYLCRSHFSVTKPQILEDMKGAGVTKETLGHVAGVATALYAVGKFIFGSLADMMGGRRLFLLGMVGAVVFSIWFGVGGAPVFLLAWSGNRFIQSSGWVGMVKLTSRWFSHSVYGRVMGFISLSYLFGDFLSRLFISQLIAEGMGWRSIFYIAAGVLAVIAIPTFFVLRDDPADRGLPEPPPNPESLFAASEEKEQKRDLGSLLLPLLSSPTFWIVCVLSFGFTFMRETFNDWTPTYLHEAANMSKENAGRASSLFPLFGGFSVIAMGYLSDRVSRSGRALLIAGGLFIGTIGLALLGYESLTGQTALVVAIVAAIAFVLIGPYSLLAGALSMGFGGKQASATAAGWIDGVGYIGGILSGSLIGSIAEKQGWPPAFRCLALTAGISCVVAMIYWWREKQTVVTA